MMDILMDSVLLVLTTVVAATSAAITNARWVQMPANVTELLSGSGYQTANVSSGIQCAAATKNVAAVAYCFNGLSCVSSFMALSTVPALVTTAGWNCKGQIKAGPTCCAAPFSVTSAGCLLVPAANLTWRDAQQYCSNLGANLYYAESDQDFDNFRNYMTSINGGPPGGGNYWYGGRKLSGSWIWTANGKAVTSQQWISPTVVLPRVNAFCGYGNSESGLSYYFINLDCLRINFFVCRSSSNALCTG